MHRTCPVKFREKDVAHPSVPLQNLQGRRPGVVGPFSAASNSQLSLTWLKSHICWNSFEWMVFFHRHTGLSLAGLQQAETSLWLTCQDWAGSMCTSEPWVTLSNLGKWIKRSHKIPETVLNNLLPLLLNRAPRNTKHAEESFILGAFNNWATQNWSHERIHGFHETKTVSQLQGCQLCMISP